MSTAMDDLRHEHDAILHSLGILGKLAAKASPGQVFQVEDALTLVSFLKEFADKCHHGKEEGILFPAMVAAGVAQAGGPIGVMLEEHDRGRMHIRAMVEALQGRPDLPRFAAEATAYMALLRQHIDKENLVLFPMAEEVLSAASLAAIHEGFEKHEETVIGQGRHEELHAMLEDFSERYLGGA